jgi:hypothetical protein
MFYSFCFDPKIFAHKWTTKRLANQRSPSFSTTPFQVGKKRKELKVMTVHVGTNWHPPHAWKPMGKLPTRIAQFLETTAL